MATRQAQEPRPCEREDCGKFLTRKQIYPSKRRRFCSHRCERLVRNPPLPPRTCERDGCETKLTRQQMQAWRATRFCSPRCGLLALKINRSQRRGIDQVLSILRANSGWWMTGSDLAIWVYGFDDFAEMHAIRQYISRLRQGGHMIIRTRLPESCRGTRMVHGYRLIEQAEHMAVISE